MRRILSLFGIRRRGCPHDWAPWSELEYLGAQYYLGLGKLFYAQRRRCLACNEIQTKQTVIQGRDEEAKAKERVRRYDPINR